MSEKEISPSLRFPSYNKSWVLKKIKDVLKKEVRPVSVKKDDLYTQIGIRSHGKGIFHKLPVQGKELGNKRVFWVSPNSLILNIVFAWEQAIAVSSYNEEGLIASHRFPMFQPIEGVSNVDYFKYFFLTQKGKSLLELASPGGAGRNKTLGQKEFDNLKFYIPTLAEQNDISSFLDGISKRIQQLQNKMSLTEKYKQGCIAGFFNQQLNFLGMDNESIVWKKKKLSEVLFEHKIRNKENNYTEVLSVAKTKGVVNQIEHLGRSYSSDDISNYKVVFPNDLVYTKSPTSDFPFGIIKQNKLQRIGVVSVLYAVYRPKNQNIGALLDYYFSNWMNTYNYLNPLVQRGAKNTMNIGNQDFLNGVRISLPVSEKVQEEAVLFLSSLDTQIQIIQNQIKQNQRFRDALLQKLFI